jgi:tetratricopeptide (TPR) repeat protein
MSPRPPIFISAVSRELRSARQLVANTLTFLGYEPVWQDIFGTEGGDLRQVLREKIDDCRGLVQLVGQCYGAELPEPDLQFGRVSYTQYEALYARERGKKVWYLFIDESYPIDPHDSEPAELRDLQAAYRKRVQSDAHLFHSLTSRDALEAGVLKLRDDLTRLRRGVKQWAAAVAILLVIIAVSVIWLLRGQRQASQNMAETKQAVSSVANEMAKLRQGLLSFPQVEASVRKTSSDKDPQALQERVYRELGKKLGLDPKLLRESVPRLAENLKSSADATFFEKATAAYVAKDYAAAESQAVQAATEAQQASPPKTADALQALQLAGLAAQRGVRYDAAMDHYRAAEKLTDEKTNPEEWARVQQGIGETLIRLGYYDQAEGVLQKVTDLRKLKLGEEHPDTLEARAALASAKSNLAKYEEAEEEYRDIVKLDEKVFGPDDSTTLWNRQMLAATLMNRGKYGEAESDFRKLVELNEKALGPEHANTLMAKNNIGAAVLQRGNYAEAKLLFTDLAEQDTKVLGPEHPQTLLARYNLAVSLLSLGEPAEAETEFRAVIPLRENTLGVTHPDTLATKRMLAVALDREKKTVEAQKLYHEVLKTCEKTFGPDSQETIDACGALALSLERQLQYADAKPYAERALAGATKLLGRDHPRTKQYADLLDAINALMK